MTLKLRPPPFVWFSMAGDQEKRTESEYFFDNDEDGGYNSDLEVNKGGHETGSTDGNNTDAEQQVGSPSSVAFSSQQWPQSFKYVLLLLPYYMLSHTGQHT